MADSFDPQNDFDAFYYAKGCGSPYERNERWLAFFQGIADQIIADLQPKNVLDAGCAKGFLVEGLRNRGAEAWGIDISEHAIQEVFDTIKPYCKVGSITDPFSQKYDLIVTIEVVEHMPAVMGKKAIENMCAHADRILFSSTPVDYRETTHYNVQPPEYWAREFARHGFFRDVDFDASFITSWAVCFKKVDQPLHQLTYDYERRFWLLWKENTDLRQLSNELSKQLKAEKKKADGLEQRWEALESTRTWKVLSSLYKVRNNK
ncbi:MAG: class I SAM-dependent methyltransferase [Bellilinea sp.]